MTRKNNCEGCSWGDFPGIVYRTFENGPNKGKIAIEFAERCDLCQRFDGDDNAKEYLKKQLKEGEE